MSDFSGLTDDELRVKLNAIGVTTPVTATTRSILLKKLMKTKGKKPVMPMVSNRVTRHSFQSFNSSATEEEEEDSQDEESQEESEEEILNTSRRSFVNNSAVGRRGHPSRTSTPTSLLSMPTNNDSRFGSRNNSSQKKTTSSSKLFPVVSPTSSASLRKLKYENYDSCSDSEDPLNSSRILRSRRSLRNGNNNDYLNNFSNVECSFNSTTNGTMDVTDYKSNEFKDKFTNKNKLFHASTGWFDNILSTSQKKTSHVNLSQPSFFTRKWNSLSAFLRDNFSCGVPTLLLILLLSFFAIIGISYVNMWGIKIQRLLPHESVMGTKLQEDGLQLPICSPNPKLNSGICLTNNEVLVARKVLPVGRRLVQETQLRSDEYQCGFHKLNYLTTQELYDKLRQWADLEEAEIPTAVSSFAKLAFVNPSLQLEPVYVGTSDDLVGIKTRKPRMHLLCAFMNAAYVFLYVVALVGVGSGVFYGVLSLVRTRQMNKYKYQQEIIDTVSKALDMIQLVDGIPVDHVRDQLFSVQERVNCVKLWADVIDFIDQHESRIVKDVGTVGGEDCEMWRWIGQSNDKKKCKENENNSDKNEKKTSAPLYPKLPMEDDSINPVNGSTIMSGWQGQALSRVNTVNPPTKYLKIRNLPTNVRTPLDIKKSLLNKCKGFPLLHIAVDEDSDEGVVYLMADSVKTAGQIFSLLHGTWFVGQLLSVKFLRDERYETRFPTSLNCWQPLTVDTLPLNIGC